MFEEDTATVFLEFPSFQTRVTPSSGVMARSGPGQETPDPGHPVLAAPPFVGQEMVSRRLHVSYSPNCQQFPEPFAEGSRGGGGGGWGVGVFLLPFFFSARAWKQGGFRGALCRTNRPVEEHIQFSPIGSSGNFHHWICFSMGRKSKCRDPAMVGFLVGTLARGQVFVLLFFFRGALSMSKYVFT